MWPLKWHAVRLTILCGCLAGSHMAHGSADSSSDIGATLELLNSGTGVVAAKAALALGSQKDLSQAAIQQLVARLDDERDGEARDPFDNFSPPTVGDHASDALVQIGTEAVVGPICEFLATSDSEEGRSRAIRTLERLGRVAHTSVDTLAVCAQDQNVRIRGWALVAIASVSANEDETIALFRHALNDDDGDVKGVAVRGLGDLGQRAAPAIPELLPLLDSPEMRGAGSGSVGWFEPLRMDVAMALGKIGPEARSALPKLDEMVRDEDFRVRIAAGFAHCRISRNRTPGLDVLLRELQSDNNRAAERAAAALGQLEYDQFVEPALDGLKRALTHANTLVRCEAAKSVAAIAPANWISLLRPLAKDPDGIVQDSVMYLFRERAAEHPELLDIFVGCLACETGQECRGMRGRRIAAEALGKMGAHGKSAIPLLQKCAENDADEGVRENAKEALQKIAAALAEERSSEETNVPRQP